MYDRGIFSSMNEKKKRILELTHEIGILIEELHQSAPIDRQEDAMSDADELHFYLGRLEHALETAFEYTFNESSDACYSTSLSITSNGDGTCRINHIGSCVDSDIVIPPIHNGDIVNAIADWAFDGCSHLTCISIPNSVTKIGSGAFRDCKNLTSISIPDSVKCIVDGVFCDCSNLINVRIPDSITSIGLAAFAGCKSLTSIALPNSVTNIDVSAFADCSGLTFMAIPNSVASLGEYAFSGCNNLTHISLPHSITHLNANAFDWFNLKEVVYSGTKKQWETLIDWDDYNKSLYWDLRVATKVICSDGTISLMVPYL